MRKYAFSTNAIDAIVAAAQQILIESAQPVRHGGQVTGPLPVLSNCPAGATFSQPSLRKSVGCYPPSPVALKLQPRRPKHLTGRSEVHRAQGTVDDNEPRVIIWLTPPELGGALKDR